MPLLGEIEKLDFLLRREAGALRAQLALPW